MKRCSPIRFWLAALIVAAALSLAAAQEDKKGEGDLDPSAPKGITPEEVIRRFTAREKEFKQEWAQYTYRQTVIVEVLDGDTVTGEYRQTFDITFDAQARKVKNVVLAPQPSLTNITKEDLDDIENRLPFTISTDELPDYNLLYAGQQAVDELHCYVFDVAPRQIDKNRRYFQGRIWVDDHDFQIVKNYGKSVPDIHLNKKGKGEENLFPRYTTWREMVDGKYWFPTYSFADDTLHFSRGGDMHIRQKVKFTNYKRFGADVKITYEGQDVQKKKEDKKPEEQKPQ